jgi:uncharacterized delta-60 repeat protein
VQRAAIAGPLAIDPSIFNDGRLVISRAAQVGKLERVRALDDGSLIAASNFSDFLNAANLLRITSTGRLDYAFGGNGIVYVDGRAAGLSAGDITLDDLVIDGRGRIVAVGHFRNASGHTSALVVRRLPNGTADPSFGDGGLATIDRAEQDTHLNPSSAPAGRASNPSTTALDGDGQPAAATDHAEPAAPWAFDDHRPVALTVLPGGEIVIVGDCTRSHVDRHVEGAAFVTWFDDRGRAGPRWMIHAEITDHGYDFSGSLSPTHFDHGYDSSTLTSPTHPAGGKLEPSPTRAAIVDASVTRAVIADDGSVVAAGQRSEQGFVMRLAPDGSRDPSFGSNGVLVLPGIDVVASLAFADRGRILVGGQSSAPSKHAAVLRVIPAGALDRTWNRSGIAVGPSADDELTDLVFATDGTVLGVGVRVIVDPAPPLDLRARSSPSSKLRRITWHPLLMRFKSDGALDTGFGMHGALVNDGPGRVFAAAVDAAGRVVLVGETSDGALIERYAGPAAGGKP